MEIKYEEFLKLDIRVGLVKNCEKIENSKNLYKLQVDCGDIGVRQILTGIASYYSPDELINEKIVVLTNLKSRTMMGFESQGMLLAADFDNEPFLLKIDERRGKTIPPGSKIK
ncbi:MAG: methionine--tRNA ligase [Candidatus Odinarchaeota archaeon]